MNPTSRHPRRSIHRSGIGLALMAALMAACFAAVAPAQDENPPAPAGSDEPKSAADQRVERAERLRRHREEMEMRMKEGAKAREERQKEADAAKRAKQLEEINRANEERALLEVEQAKAEGKPIPDKALKVLAGRQDAQRQASYDKVEGVFYADPLSAHIPEGDRAAVDIVYYNKGDSAVTELTIALEYPPWGVRPVAAYVDGLERAFRDAKVVVHNDDERGLITIHASSPRPTIFKSGRMATIVWEGIAPMRDTPIRFVFRDELGTAALLGGESKLGIPEVPDDGVVAGNLRVSPAAEARLEVRKTGDGGIIAGLFDDWSLGEVALFLAPDKRVVHVGETFSVAVCLLNPDRSEFDKLQVVLRFDPEALEAVDFDKGANIRQGINMEDGPLAWRFAFDHHFANQADNAAGLFTYKAAAANGDGNQGEGVIAIARFKAKKPVSSTSIVFVHPKEKLDKEGTRISRLGEDILARDRLEESAVVRLLPALPGAEPPLEEAAPGAEGEGPKRFISAAERKAARDKELAEWRENRAKPGGEVVVTVGDLSFIGAENPLQQAKKPGEAAAPPAGGSVDPSTREVR